MNSSNRFHKPVALTAAIAFSLVSLGALSGCHEIPIPAKGNTQPVWESQKVSEVANSLGVETQPNPDEMAEKLVTSGNQAAAAVENMSVPEMGEKAEGLVNKVAGHAEQKVDELMAQYANEETATDIKNAIDGVIADAKSFLNIQDPETFLRGLGS